jgi:abortive infection bacteriophage resistance protein
MAKKKTIEFSKKIFYMTSIITVIVILYSMALMWKTNDTSALAYLIPSVLGEMGVATGFYYSKAKIENKIKLSKKYGLDITNETINDVDDIDIVSEESEQ